MASRTSTAPDDPTDISGPGKKAIFKRALKEFKEDNVTDWAAALTYYGVLSLFPALIALISILGLFGKKAGQTLIDNLSAVAPGPAKDIITNAITGITSSPSKAGLLFVVGLLAALWSASGYVAAFMRASNSIYDIEEGRPIWKTLPTRVGTTLVLVVLLVVVALAVVVSGPVLEQVGKLFGLGDTLLTVFSIAKWPILLLVVSFMFAFLYWAAPNVKQPGFKWVSPGGLVATIIWILASVLFAFYVANFGSYNKTYGTLGGVVSFLVWLWISNVAILLGAEFNAELERARRIEAGDVRPDQEPFAEPRDTRKMEKNK
ncbi:MAG TPA: YihY/virulence factor BrkB family protein [Solirubrobacteraceae bacterium]|jgi:membrane protein